MKRYVAPIVTAVAALVIFSPGVVSGGNQSRAEKIAPCKQTIRTIVDRRAATWKWERKLEVNRTPTEFKEKRTGSCRYLKYQKRKWSVRADKRFRTVVKLETDPKAAIAWVFGEYKEQAYGVAWCESRFSIWAENGQYLGLFQMGSSERQLFGHGDTAIEQARAAHRYFVSSGRDWSPWACRWAAY